VHPEAAIIAAVAAARAFDTQIHTDTKITAIDLVDGRGRRPHRYPIVHPTPW